MTGRHELKPSTRERYAPAERLYVAEADPVTGADVIIDNTCHSNPVLLWLRGMA